MAAESGDSNGQQEGYSFTEGKAKISSKEKIFYNPVQEFNRDLTVICLREFVRSRMERLQNKTSDGEPEEPAVKKKKLVSEKGDGSIRILDALSASGLRAMRFSQEVPNVEFVLANDFSEEAVANIKRNIVLNGVENLVRGHFGDAVETMMAHRSLDKRFHAVDLDPYGSASVFLDSAVQCVADDGILMVTCTDMAVLCGNHPEACYNKYGATTVRLKCCHEMALRILLRSIDSHANKYSRYIEPLVAISIDFYVRVFLRIRTSAKVAKDSAAKVGNLLACSGCHSMEVHPILRKEEKGISVRYVPSIVRQTIMDGENKCVHCTHPVHQVGPLYIAPIHSKEFVGKLLESLRNTPEDQRLGTHNRLLGVLTTVLEEVDAPLYYEHDQLANVVKCAVPKSILMKSAILNAGYKVSGSHCNPRALKTDAPIGFLWDIIRRVAKDTNVKIEKIDPQAPGRKILAKDITYEINFSLNNGVAVQKKTEQMVRFQCNKGKNWGPRQKAKGSVNSTQAGFQVQADREESVKRVEEKLAE